MKVRAIYSHKNSSSSIILITACGSIRRFKTNTALELTGFKSCTLANCTSVHAVAKWPPLGESHRGYSFVSYWCHWVCAPHHPSVLLSGFVLDPTGTLFPTTYWHCDCLILPYKHLPHSPQLLFPGKLIWIPHAIFRTYIKKLLVVCLKLKCNWHLFCNFIC